MKKLSVLLVLLSGLISCENQKNDFPDFEYTTGYFPYQYPVRTLILGDYIYDNSNDNNHKFLISAAMGGVYQNTRDRIFKIEVDNSLCEGVNFGSTNQPIYALPSKYYTLSSTDQIVIPAGEVNGNIAVQLTDDFFDDTLAIKLGYVLPVRIREVTNLDSLLSGKPAVAAPDSRIVSHWEIAPKDFTMFAVKYINPYHGNYFHRGRSAFTDSSGAVSQTVYRQQYIENDEVWNLITTGRNQVKVEGVIRATGLSGNFSMLLTFNGNDCVVQSPEGASYAVTGSGKFMDDADEWGNKKRDAIHLTYEFTDGDTHYSATDTLVIRDRGVSLEVFQPVLTGN